MIRSLLVLLSLLFSVSSLAQMQKSRVKPLYFQADKNNLQVLPQRFEYSLLDDDRLKVGDIIIDASQVTFELTPSVQKKGTYDIRFSWPAGLLQEGELAVKNNSGKAIFNATLNPKNIDLTKGTDEDGQDLLRSDKASFTAKNIPATLIDDMKYFPFMTFCIFREAEGTRFYLCSKELFLSSQDGQMSIKARSSNQKAAQIEINGKVVGSQGIIYLNDRSEEVVFKARSKSGAFIEIETRRKDVDFKDVVLSNDGEKIILTASGTEPVNADKVKKLSATDWQIELPKARPLLYLKGEGDIPMRQEFYIRGQLPRQKDRPYVSAKAPEKTYSSTLIINGISPEEVKVSVPAEDAKSRLEDSKKNQFLWTLTGIPSGVSHRRYLNVDSAGKNFVAGYDIFRGHPFSLNVGLQFQNPSGIAFGSVEFQWWIENFLLLNTDFTRFHWGVAVERKQHLTEKDDIAAVDFTTFELLWRARSGFHLIDGTWGLILPMQMVEGEGANAMTYGFGAFLNQKAHDVWLQYAMDWYEWKLHYFAGSSGSDFKIKSAYSLKALAYKKWSDEWFFRYGLDLSQHKFDPAAGKEDLQMGVNAGVYFKF